MAPRAYEEWINLYDDQLIEVWHQEREELKKAAMILCILKQEFNKIQKDVEQDMISIRSSLEKRDKLKNLQTQSLAENIRINKENMGPLWSASCSGIQPLESIDEYESPEIFKVASPKRNKPSQQRLSDTETSPTIIKRIKRHCHKKFKQDLSPSLLAGSCPDTKLKTPLNNNKADLLNTGFKTPTMSLEETHLNGAFNDDMFDNTTIIDSTPVVKSMKKHTSIKNSSLKNKSRPNSILKKNPLKQQTLTQKFESNQLSKIKQKEPDPDKTCLDADDFPSSMEIDQILKYVDQFCDTSSSSSNLSKASTSPGGPSADSDCILVKPETTTKIKTSTNNCDNGEINSNNLVIDLTKPEVKQFQLSPRFIQNYDKIDKPKEETPKEPYKEVVRGKEKKNLKGWACQECKKYYEGLNLPPEELEKKMDDCSKHKSRFKPDDNTYAAYWDMDMADTPNTETQGDQSTIFHL